MSEKEYAVRPNKSQIKRELRALNDLGKELAGLPDAALLKIPLSEELRFAIADAKRFSRGALQRQLRRIVALLKLADVDAITQELHRQKQPSKQQTAEFHQLEQWRDRLVAGDEQLLTELIDQFPAIDRQMLRQLVRNAQKEKRREQSPKAARKIFRILCEVKQQSSVDIELAAETGHTYPD